MFQHEKLVVYQKASVAAVELLRLADGLPERRRDLAEQLRSAAASVPLNIAEGANEFSSAEKTRFYRIARRSAGECAAILDLVAGSVPIPSDVAPHKGRLNEVVALLTRLILAPTRK